MSAVHGEFDWRIWDSLTVCSWLRYGSSTWIWNFKLVLGLGSSSENLDWNPPICYGQNMFFYNCYTCKQLLIILLYHQWFIVLSCYTIDPIIKHKWHLFNFYPTLHYSAVVHNIIICIYFISRLLYHLKSSILPIYICPLTHVLILDASIINT